MHSHSHSHSHSHCQYWFVNDRSNTEKLTEIVNRIKASIRMRTYGLSEADVCDIAQEALLQLIEAGYRLLKNENYFHILLTGRVDNPAFLAYLSVTAVHETYRLNRNVKFILPNQFERMQGVKYTKIFYEIYDTTDRIEEGQSHYFEENNIDMENYHLQEENINELARVLKSAIDDTLSLEDPTRQLFLKTVLLNSYASNSKRTYAEIAADIGFSHSNVRQVVKRFRDDIYDNIVQKLELKNSKNLKSFKKGLPDLLFFTYQMCA